jgi:zeaxanthin glucosyltransferase
VQNGVETIYCNIAKACIGLNMQLVLALGRNGASLNATTLPDGAIVVDFAPQLQLLEKAAAIVSHCGTNTALEAISHGVPVIAVPITNDQPGVASRLVYLGVAQLISPPKKATSVRLRLAIQEILENPNYVQATRQWQRNLRDARRWIDGRVDRGCVDGARIPLSQRSQSQKYSEE